MSSTHPGVKHKSFGFYHKTLESVAEKIMTKIKKHWYKKVAKLINKILRKIQEDVKKSRFLPEKF
jgi:hypothetical protein